jgi:hypothetical protein
VLKYIIALGVSAVVASSAAAAPQKHTSPAPTYAGAQCGLSSFARVPRAADNMNNPYVVRDERGEEIGADPDVNVRRQLLRDHHTY